jgi:hypothetical protein
MFVCVSELFDLYSNFFTNLENLTNTFKLTHRNEQNTNKISYLGVEGFHTPQAVSLCIFNPWCKGFTHISIRKKKFHSIYKKRIYKISIHIFHFHIINYDYGRFK